MHDVDRAAADSVPRGGEWAAAARVRPGGSPVFVDHRGRRRRWLAGSGLAVAVLCVLYVVLLIAGLTADPVRPDGGTGSVDVPAERAPRPAEVGVSR